MLDFGGVIPARHRSPHDGGLSTADRGIADLAMGRPDRGELLQASRAGGLRTGAPAPWRDPERGCADGDWYALAQPRHACVLSCAHTRADAAGRDRAVRASAHARRRLRSIEKLAVIPGPSERGAPESPIRYTSFTFFSG